MCSAHYVWQRARITTQQRVIAFSTLWMGRVGEFGSDLGKEDLEPGAPNRCMHRGESQSYWLTQGLITLVHNSYDECSSRHSP